MGRPPPALSLNTQLPFPPRCTVRFLLKPGLPLPSCLELFNLSAHEKHVQGLGGKAASEQGEKLSENGNLPLPPWFILGPSLSQTKRETSASEQSGP